MEGSTSHGPEVPKEKEDSASLTDQDKRLRFLVKGFMKMHKDHKCFTEKSITDTLQLLNEMLPEGTPCPESFAELKKLSEEFEEEENHNQKQEKAAKSEEFEEEENHNQKQEKAAKKN